MSYPYKYFAHTHARVSRHFFLFLGFSSFCLRMTFINQIIPNKREKNNKKIDSGVNTNCVRCVLFYSNLFFCVLFIMIFGVCMCMCMCTCTCACACACACRWFLRDLCAHVGAVCLRLPFFFVDVLHMLCGG